MGNQLTKKQTSTKKSNPNDDFIIRYNKTYTNNDNLINLKTLDKRLIFVSLIGLQKSWASTPPYLLYSAIFLLPLKSVWIYNPIQYKDEIQSNFICQLSSFSDITESGEFVQLLRWKDSQGLLVWMLDHLDVKHSVIQKYSMIHPFWHYFSKTLTGLTNPISNAKYNELDLDENHWQKKMPLKHKYCAKRVSLLSELYFVNAKFKPMQEIIYQSNPNSLLPIISYSNDQKQNIYKKLSNTKFDLFTEFENDDNDDNWILSDDYDPFDL